MHKQIQEKYLNISETRMNQMDYTSQPDIEWTVVTGTKVHPENFFSKEICLEAKI